MDRTELMRLAERAGGVSGLLAGEATRAILQAAWGLTMPRPTARVARQADGSLWPGDGLGPYTPEYKAWLELNDRFNKLLQLGAFENAAMMLVPEGWHWRLYSNSLGTGPEAQVQKERSVAIATGATPALALVASCLRARVGGEG